MDGSGNNVKYSLDLKGSEIGSGQHSYYFHFEDGYDGVTTTPEKTFTVTKSKIVSYQPGYYLLKFLEQFPFLEKFFSLLFQKLFYFN